MTSSSQPKNSEHAVKTTLEDYSPGARKLILAAERLFGQHGIDNVSLRQIVAAAGQANNYAVQHHFGSKEGLIEAIFTVRMAVLDAARLKMLNELKAENDLTPKRIIWAIMQPILDAFDEKERHLYADFMFHLFHRNKVQAGSIMSGNLPTYSSFAPAVKELNDLLRKKLSHLPIGVFNTRYRLAAELFLSGLIERKRLHINKGQTYPSQDLFWRDMLTLTVAIFEAPYPSQ